MKSDSFPHTEGKHDFQYSSFSAGVHTKIISGYFTKDYHSIWDLSMFPNIMAKTVNMCPQIETIPGDTLYSNIRIFSITE